MHTNTRKLLSGALVAGLTLASHVSAASNIGTGTVVDSGALTSTVVWDDAFPGVATGVVNGLVVQAQVRPVLNMTISGSGVINLGVLTSDTYNSGSVNMEVGTNAANGSTITVRSANGGLQNAPNSSIYINNLTTDEVADSYKFSGAVNTTDDSSYAAFTQTCAIATGVEVNDNTTNHVLYSSNRPQKLDQVDDVTLTVSAKPDIESPAGRYSDLLVVTVTGNF